MKRLPRLVVKYATRPLFLSLVLTIDKKSELQLELVQKDTEISTLKSLENVFTPNGMATVKSSKDVSYEFSKSKTWLYSF